jgi:hypothetical protein
VVFLFKNKIKRRRKWQKQKGKNKFFANDAPRRFRNPKAITAGLAGTE